MEDRIGQRARARRRQLFGIAALVLLYGAIALPVNYGVMPIYFDAIVNAGSYSAAQQRLQDFVAVMFVPTLGVVLAFALQPVLLPLLQRWRMRR